MTTKYIQLFFITLKQTKMANTQTTIEKLIKFVNQRPGLDFANYGDVSAYRSESREITKDRSDFFELLGLASRNIENLEDKLTELLIRSSDRLTLDKDGNLQYITGQYFPTEYRPAACRALRSLIWDSYANYKDGNGQPIYSTGHEIRKAIKRNLSRRVGKNYFN